MEFTFLFSVLIKGVAGLPKHVLYRYYVKPKILYLGIGTHGQQFYI